MKLPLFAVLSLTSSLAFSADEFHYSRTYQLNEKFGYTLSTVSTENGQFESEDTAESDHKVILDGVPFEEISWKNLSKKDKNGSSNLSIDAKNVKPYQISLHSDGSLKIPALTVPSMVGMITDLNTFYVAISKSIGMQKISRLGDVYENPEMLKGNWADGVNSLVGQDCTNVTLSMVELKQDIAVVKTAFLAPKKECISMNKSWMLVPVKDGTPNNIQQITKTGDSYMAMWGHEQFIIITEIDRASGIIRHATMDNTLTLKMKTGCDSNLDNCQSEFPLTIQRDEQLKLKK